MAAGHHDIVGDAQVLGGEVTQGGRDQPQFSDVAAGFKEALDQCLGQFGAFGAAVPGHQAGILILFPNLTPNRLANETSDLCGEFLIDPTTYIVGPEQVWAEGRCTQNNPLMGTGVAKATFATFTAIELIDDFKIRLDHGYEHQLSNTLTDVDGEGLVSSVPGRDKKLALIIRINQAHQVTQNNAMFMAQAGTGQDGGRETRV